MKVAVCAAGRSPEDLRVWSGTPAHFLQAWRSAQDDEIVSLPGLSPATFFMGRVVCSVTKRANRGLNWESEPFALERFTNAMRRSIRGLSPDVVLLMGWYPWALRRDDPPCVFWGDATVGQRIDSAPHWSHLGRRTRRQAEAVERASMETLAGVFMASSWARNDLIHRYDYNPERAFVVPFGSNLRDPGEIVKDSPTGAVRLLTVGVDWRRKGIDTSVACVDLLRARGVDASLDVVGVKPPDSSWHRPHVRYHGFLSKDVASEQAMLDQLYRSADVFLLPTRNDPFAIVLCEASCYGTPVVASAVGGIPDRVREGGALLSEGASPSHYADAVQAVLTSPEFKSLSVGARRDYLNYGTWEASVDRAVDALERLAVT